MADPEIRTYERNLREMFKDARDLAVHIARLSVLFEDLRLESTAAQCIEPIKEVDTSGRNYRCLYFLRRMAVTLDEFQRALQSIDMNSDWKKIRKKFDPETEKRWASAVKFFQANRQTWADFRNDLGGHVLEQAAAFAVDNLREGSTGKIEIVINREEKTGGIRLLYAEELVAVVMRRGLGLGDPTDEQIGTHMNELFTIMMSAVNEAVKAVHVIAIAYVVGRFTKE